MIYRYRSTVYDIVVENSGAGSGGAGFLEIDGRKADGMEFNLDDDGGRHQVRVILEPVRR